MSFVESVRQLRKDEWIEEEFNTMIYTNSTLKKFQIVEVKNLKNIVRKLPNKAGTEEGITVEIMKLVIEVADKQIANIVNKSLELGIFPYEWKESVSSSIES